VFAEACMHHLALDASLYDGDDARRYLTVPPLRPREHVDALWDGVRDGAIDTVGSDHSQVRYQPPSADDFTGLPYGLPGAGLRVPMLLSAGRARGVPLERLVELASTAPARIFGLHPRKGVIATGADADLVAWDPEPEWTVEDEASPYFGLRVQGRIRVVIARGAPLVQDGEWVGGTPEGRFLASPTAR
jgi:dihydropyrimidinase